MSPPNVARLDPLSDVRAERAVVHLLAEVSSSQSIRHARDLLDGSKLTPDDFHSVPCRVVFEAQRELLHRNESAGPVELWEAVRTREPFNGKDGFDRLRELVLSDDGLAAWEGMPSYARILREQSLRRRLVNVVKTVHRAVVSGAIPVAEALALAQREMNAISTGDAKWRPLRRVMTGVSQKVQDVSDGKFDPCVRTGFASIDHSIGGLPYNLTAIGAMAGVGKSAFLATLFQSIARSGVTAAIFSLEDKAEWLGFRYLAEASGVNQFILRYKPLNDMQWSSVGDGFSRVSEFDERILVDDRERLAPEDVLGAAREAVISYGAKVIAVDNITSMRFRVPRGERLDRTILEFLADFRALCVDLQVAGIVVSHVKRREKLSQGDVPYLTDFSEASGFENCARLAFGLAREPGSDEMKVGILKATNGKAGKVVKLRFVGAAAMVQEFEQMEQGELL